VIRIVPGVDDLPVWRDIVRRPRPTRALGREGRRCASGERPPLAGLDAA
jgi:hypothetical protein